MPTGQEWRRFFVYDDKQAALIRAAIHAVAQDGLERTTTRSIGAAAGINDAYIYR